MIYDGKETGGTERKLLALPRKTPIRQDRLYCKSGVEIIPAADLKQFYGRPLLQHVHDILDQGSVGSCATEATTQGLMICRSIAKMKHRLLNPWTIYRLVTNYDSGSDIGEDVDVACETGIVPMDLWDRAEHRWKSAPPAEIQAAAKDYQIDEFWEITSREEMQTAIALGEVVVFGVYWSGGGGHAITAIGQDKDSVHFVGSWGPTAHDGDGTGTLPWRQVERGLQAFTCRAIRCAKLSN